jgi:hypothetical protein
LFTASVPQKDVGEIMSDANEPATIEAPSAEALCLQTPLYFPTPIGPTARDLLKSLRQREVQFDAPCIHCRKMSTFKSVAYARGGGAGMPTPPADWMFKPTDISLEVHCQRNPFHEYSFLFRLTKDAIIKFGQYPSMEDIAASDLQRFRAVMSREDFAELHRAGGLASHGIGIGAFVYLRRIFERLINKARISATDAGEQLTDFEKLRMVEKIGALAKFLPPTLVKHKSVYGILSVGLHELDEDTCRKYFPAVRAAILDMLEQDVEAENKRKAAADLESEIGKISTALSKA